MKDCGNNAPAVNKEYKVCFVCTGNACRSPFAECVTKVILKEEGIEGIEVFSLGTLDWGENPRDAAMVYAARQMGYSLAGATTHMTREALMTADLIIVFDEHHRNAVTRDLDYDRWNRIVMFNKAAFGTDGPVEDPHFQSAAVYKKIAKHIEEGCRRIAEQWKHTLPGQWHSIRPQP